MDENCWDDVAMVPYALHRRDEQPVVSVTWNAVLWQLPDDRHVNGLVNGVLPGAGRDLARTAAPGDPVAETWRWLASHLGPPRAHEGFPLDTPGPAARHRERVLADAPEARWGGMNRGIGSGIPDPAIVVSRPLLSHQSGVPDPGGGRRAALLGVSEIAGKRYSFESWEVAA
ncbi:hypothetical protein [Streptomyces sp. NPDC059928]|uniref:hypothetical protein n=1 Tax=unclassified Streptomyces TaxID=2593676 RepID=UPI0036629D7C